MELSEKAKSLRIGVYGHFKGGQYRVLGVARHSETLEEMVMYQEDSGMWVRPLAMFLEKVEKDGYSGPRFKYIGE